MRCMISFPLFESFARPQHQAHSVKGRKLKIVWRATNDEDENYVDALDLSARCDAIIDNANLCAVASKLGSQCHSNRTCTDDHHL